MVHEAVCLEKEVLIEDASIDDVTGFCNKALKEMRLKITKEESTSDGKTTIFASEGRLVPIVSKVLLFPFSLNEYMRIAQRSGVHVVISSGKDGIHVYSCGLALDEASGKLAEYTKDEVLEEVTDTMEALDFENKFIKRILEHFPKAKEIS
jgi:hypothetical protein